MSDLRDFVPAGTTSVQSDRASAIRPHAEGSVLGGWWLHGANILEWIAESDDQSLYGRIRLQPAGWAQVVLDDIPGWRPFASFAGTDEGRRIQLTTRHAFDGTMVETSSDMEYDSTLGRHVAFGSTSDGSLASSGFRSRILIAAVDQQEWQIDDIVFGWAQIGDQP